MRRLGAVGRFCKVVGCVAVAVLLAAGCSSKPRHSLLGSATPVGTGLLATNRDSYAYYIQWTGIGGTLSGTMQVDALSGIPPNESVSTDTEQISAQINGTQADVNLGDAGEVLGTFSGEILKLNIPQQDGTLEALTFNPATSADFNNAVASIQSRVQSDNETGSMVQQAESERAAIDKAGAAAQQDIQNLASDRSDIVTEVDDLPNALGDEKSQLAATASAEAKVIQEARSGADQSQVCSDADGVASDADGVYSDGDGVSSDADGVKGALSSAQSDIAATGHDLQSLKVAEAILPGYQGSAPSVNDVQQAVTATASAITSAVSTTNGDIGTANSYQTQAFQDAQAAASVGSCAAPASPSAQPTITSPS